MTIITIWVSGSQVPCPAEGYPLIAVCVNTSTSGVRRCFLSGAARHAAALVPRFMTCKSNITFTPHVISVALLPVFCRRYDLELI